MTRAIAVFIAAAASCGCASLAPAPSRFLVVYEQRTAACRIQVLKDARSAACFVAFRCGRQPIAVVAAPVETCVP